MIDRMNAGKQFSKIKFKQWTCYVVASYYVTEKRKAIMLMDTEDKQLIATATVNIPDYPCESNHVYIKDYAENEGVKDALINCGILLPHSINTLKNKYVEISLMQLTPEALNLWIDTNNKN